MSEHGLTGHYYRQHHCRCDKCKRWWADYIKELRDKRALLSSDKIPHGLNGYQNYRCKCDVCKAAWVSTWPEYYTPEYMRERRRKKELMLSESQLLTAVLSLCEKYRLLVFHSTDSRRDIGCGYPDLTILGKQLLFAELKSNAGYMRPEQTAWKYALKSAGVTHHVWRPDDLADGTIERALKSLGTTQ